MASRAVVLALVALATAVGGCGGDETSTDAARTDHLKADPRPLFGPCDSGKAKGADGLTCEDAEKAISLWSRFHDWGGTLQRCQGETAGFDHLAGDGITCAAVDDFVAHDFAPHPDGWVERQAGATCRISEGRDGLHVACRRQGHWFAFSFA
jgi:hypothetical protein